MVVAAEYRDLLQEEIENIISIIQPGNYIRREFNGRLKYFVDTTSPNPRYPYEDFVYVYGSTKDVRQYQVESQRAMMRYLIEIQKPKVAVKPNGENSFELIRKAFLKTIKRSQAGPGATVGNFACDALSQPLTQTTLNAHKTIGAAATYSNVTERVTQILHVSHTQKQRVMTLHFIDKYLTFDDIIQLRTQIEETKLFTVADIIMSSMKVEEAKDIIDNDDIALSYRLMNNMLEDNFKEDVEVRILSINAELMYQHNLDIFKLCVRVTESSNGMLYAIPTYEEEKYKIYLFLSNDLNIKKDQTVNDYFNKEIKHYMDDRIISGVRGIRAIYPRRERILGLIQNVYDGKYEIDGKIYNKACILNLPECVKLSIDASRFRYAFEFANIPFTYVSKDKSDKWNPDNYVFYVKSPTKDVVSRVREFYTILNNIRDNDEYLRKTIEHLTEERYQELFKDFVNEKFQNTFKNIKQELNRIIYSTEYYYCVTDGTNFRELPKQEIFDFSSCTSNILYEVYDLMDVVGYRSAAIREMNLALGGSYINHQHISLTIDNICKMGAPYSVTADGLEKMSATVMQLSTKKEPMKYASRSAIRGEKMSMAGSLSAQMASQQARTGSGQVDVVLDMNKMNQVIGKDKALQMAKSFSIGRSFIVPSKSEEKIKEKREPRMKPREFVARIEELKEEPTTKTNLFSKFRSQAPAGTLKSQGKPEYSLKKKDNVEFLEKVVPSVYTNAMDVEFNKSILQKKIEYPLNTKENPTDEERFDFKNPRLPFSYDKPEQQQMKSIINFIDSLPKLPASKYYEIRLKKEIYGNVDITNVIKKRFNVRGASKLGNPESVNGIFEIGSGILTPDNVYNYINDEVSRMKKDYSRFFD